MNIKLKRQGVYCLVENYDQVYSIITREIKVPGLTFCKRQAGAGYLQWSLPGNDWKPLSKASEVERTLLRQQIDSLFQSVKAGFSNEKLAQAILTVPSDDYIFYNASDGGQLQVAITAWGYRFPKSDSDPTPPHRDDDSQVLQMVNLCFIYEEVKQPNLPFTLISYKRVTDSEGFFKVGMLPVGNELPVKLDDDHSFTLTVTKGQSLYTFDITEYVTLVVKVRKDDKPYAGATCKLQYNGRETTMTTGATGEVSVSWPYCREGAEANVTVEDQQQSKTAARPKTEFVFDFVTPPMQEPPKQEPPKQEPPKQEPPKEEPPVEEPPKEEPPKEEPPVQEPPKSTVPPPEEKMVRFRILGYKGMPLPELEFTIKTKKSGVLNGITDADGYAEFPASLFVDGEKPKLNFTISREYQSRHDIHAKPAKKR